MDPSSRRIKKFHHYDRFVYIRVATLLSRDAIDRDVTPHVGPGGTLVSIAGVLGSENKKPVRVVGL